MPNWNIFVWTISLCLFIMGCRNDSKNDLNTISIVRGKTDKDSIAESIIEKFSLPYANILKTDSNSLFFYCSRAYDTSSLIHIQKRLTEIRGIFYQMLPIYHRFTNDFNDPKTKLLFFEGYSFIIDTSTWQKIKSRAETIIQADKKVRKNVSFTDGATYALYYNLQSSHGNTYNDTLYEDLDSFCKESFLDSFFKARKPLMHK